MVAVLAGREVDPSVVVMGQLEALGHITALPPIESSHFQGMIAVSQRPVHASAGVMPGWAMRLPAVTEGGAVLLLLLSDRRAQGLHAGDQRPAGRREAQSPDVGWLEPSAWA